MRLALVVLALLSLTYVPGGRAWTLGPGVVIGSDTVTTYTTGASIEVEGSLTYESTTGSVIINGYVIDLGPDDGTTPYAWFLNDVSDDRVVVEGDPTVPGTFRFAGYTGLWSVSGILGEQDFLISGPSVVLDVPAGEQTIVIQRQNGTLLNGPRIALNAEYDTAAHLVHVVVVLSHADGTPYEGEAASITGTIYDTTGAPDVFATFTFTEDPGLPGIYLATHDATTPPMAGTYLVTAEWNGLRDAEHITVDTELSHMSAFFSELAPYTHIFVWGGLLLYLLGRDAVAPAMGSLIALANFLLPTPVFGVPAAVMLVSILVAVHALLSWRKRAREEAAAVGGGAGA